MNRDEIHEYLLQQDEMDPNMHDGSYELFRATVNAYNGVDLTDADYNDWNTLYFMIIGTWKSSVSVKKKFISESHLPENRKTELTNVLESIYKKAQAGEYQNQEGVASIGMFGTGFQSFKRNGTHDGFIRMIGCLTRLLDDSMTDEECFSIAEETLSQKISGIGAAAASMMLHCIRPMTFPIMNGHQVASDIFIYLGVKIKKRNDASSYIANCRRIKEFRDNNYTIKNYRIFDIASWKIDDSISESSASLEKVIGRYKAEFARVDSEERYKWQAVKHFQDVWDIEAEDFTEMLREAISYASNLLNSRMFFPAGMIVDLSSRDPEAVREMFKNLFDEEIPFLDRISSFMEKADEIKNRYTEWVDKSSYQTYNSVSVYLFFRYPEKYYIYKSKKFRRAAEVLQYSNVPTTGDIASVDAYFDLVDIVWKRIKDDSELLELNHSRLGESEYADLSNHILAEDIILFASRISDNATYDNKISLEHGCNILLYGVPGAGKSHTIKSQYCDNPNFMERVVFHPDYTYADFVGQILPRVEDDELEYVFMPGPFTNTLKHAFSDPQNMYYLVIEEINRGNAPMIFGEIFQLLDRKDDSEYPLEEVGESEYGITNFDIAREVYGDENHPVKLPRNLVVLATMNTADQNVFTLDTAFQRRWDMKQIENDVLMAQHADEYIEGNEITWGAFAVVTNEIVLETSFGIGSTEDKRLGAYFVKRKELTKKCFSEKVLKYLWDDVFKLDRSMYFKEDIKSIDQLFTKYLSETQNSLECVLKKEVFDRMINYNPDTVEELAEE